VKYIKIFYLLTTILACDVRKYTIKIFIKYIKMEASIEQHSYCLNLFVKLSKNFFFLVN